MDKLSYETKLEKLTKDYVKGLPKQLSSISAAWQYLQDVNWDKKALTAMAQGAHKLVGSGETFRFPAISSAAKALEDQLLELLTQTDARTQQRQRVQDALTRLSNVIEQIVNTAAQQPSPASDIPVQSASAKAFHIAIIEDDAHQADFLQVALQQQGYKTTAFLDPDAFSKASTEQQFDLILLDIGFPKGPLEGISWLSELKQRIGTFTPVIVLSARADMVARMRALRAGAEAYLIKPVNLAALSEKIEHIRDKAAESKAHILWVDDDADLLALYKNLLSHEGYQVECVNQSLKLLEHIERFLPDVIILDYQMPNCNGVELAQLLKQDSRFMTTPIIFVSASAEAAALKEQLSIVGNAFLKKPLDNAAFLQCLRQQIAKADLITHRIRQISQRFEQHGLQNQSFFLAELETVLAGVDAALDKETFYLVQATVDQEDYLRQTYGLRAMATLTGSIERFLAQHPKVNGVGCTLGGGVIPPIFN